MGNKEINRNRNVIEFELERVLQRFQEGYTKRDITGIDNFMNDLFDKDEEVIILGTSHDEWYFNFEEAKELFLSDWEWWGDVQINIKDAIITSNEDFVWLTTTGTVKYEHDNSEETYSRWFDHIKDYYFSKNKEVDTIDLTEINWKINHLLHDWDKEKRTYLSPIRFSAVLKRKNNRFIFKQIQYSFPAPLYPDMRIDNKNMKRETFESTKEKLIAYNRTRTQKNNIEIEHLLTEFQDNYFASKPSNLVRDYFVNHQSSRFIGTNRSYAIGYEEIEQLMINHQENWNSLEIDAENAIINSESDVAWVITEGKITKIIDESIELKNQIETIKTIFDKEMTPKDKLFNIRKNISMVLKELEKGNLFEWPFRFEAVLFKQNNQWRISYLQFSYPFYWILEGLREEERI